MRPCTRVTVAALTGAFFVSATPAVAETQISVTDFPWGLQEGRSEDVRIALGDLGTLAIDWLEVKRYGDDAITVSVSPRTVFLNQIETMEIEAQVASENWVMDFGRMTEGEDVTFDLTADTLDVTFTSQPSYAPDSAGTEASFESEDLLVIANIKRFDIITSVLEGGALPAPDLMNAINLVTVMEMETWQSRTIVPSEWDKTRQLISINESGPQRTEFSMRDGTFTVSGNAEYGRIVENDPIPFEVDHGDVSFNFVVPTAASPDPQEFVFDFRLGDFTIDEETWALFDPEAIFPRSAGNLVFDASMQAILSMSLLDIPAVQRAERNGETPIRPVGVTLNAFEIDALGLEAKGEGTAELEGTLPTSLSGLFSVKGLADLMDNALEAGLLKPPQAMMAEGMANHLGKKEDDGTLTFDVGIEGGMVTINDAPVAPLPQ